VKARSVAEVGARPTDEKRIRVSGKRSYLSRIEGNTTVQWCCRPVIDYRSCSVHHFPLTPFKPRFPAVLQPQRTAGSVVLPTSTSWLDLNGKQPPTH